MRWIDAHLHLHSLPGHPWDSPPERIIPLLDESGIETAAIMPYSDARPGDDRLLDEMLAAAEKFPGRFIPFARLAPGPGAVEQLTAAAGRGFAGLKLHPVGYAMAPDHPEVLALLEAAGALGLPALFHSGDEDYCRPLEILAAARQVPDTKIILGHMGGYFHVDDALYAARECNNIILETSAMPYPGKIEEAVSVAGAERVLYASDGPGCLPRLEVEKILRTGIEGDILAGIAGRNFLSLLRPGDRKRWLREKEIPVSRSVLELPGPMTDGRVYCRVDGHKQISGSRVYGATVAEICQAMTVSGVNRVQLLPGFSGTGYQSLNGEIGEIARSRGWTAAWRLQPLDRCELNNALSALRAGDVSTFCLHPFEDGYRANDDEVVCAARLIGDAGGKLILEAGHAGVSRLEQWIELAGLAPQTQITVAGAGQRNICGSWLEPVFAAFSSNSNLFADSGGIYRQDFIERLAREFGAERIRFGSGFPACSMEFEAWRFACLNLPSSTVAGMTGDVKSAIHCV